MFETKTKLPPELVEDAIHITDTNFICCKRSATTEILHTDSRRCALFTPQISSSENSSSQRWRDKRHQGSSNHLKWPRETLKHWPGQTMYPQFFFFFFCLDCAPAHYFTSSSILKRDRCSRCLSDQSAARWIQGPLRMFSEIQGGFSLVLSNTQSYSHTCCLTSKTFNQLNGEHDPRCFNSLTLIHSFNVNEWYHARCGPGHQE